MQREVPAAPHESMHGTVVPSSQPPAESGSSTRASRVPPSDRVRPFGGDPVAHAQTSAADATTQRAMPEE
jgi:hypothetical protein